MRGSYWLGAVGELMVFTTPLALAAGVLGGVVVFGHAVFTGSVHSTATTTSILASCNEENPYLAVTAYVRYHVPDRRTVVAVRDSFPEDWDRDAGTGIGGIVLARESQTGNVHGLAVDPKMGLVYTSAYFKALTSFGPAGPGGIYRITVDPHRVEAWMSIPAGMDPHDLGVLPEDPDAPTWVGRTSLGDLELSEDGGTLFATNLSDRLIYRISVPERRVLSTMRHGAADEPWAANARPFGLAVHQGWVYHGLVDSREDSSLPGSLSAHVYRSRADGSMLSKVASFALDYPRTPAWQPWQDGVPVDPETRSQPMLTDLGVRANGDIVVALTDRLRDVSYWVYANGDLVRLRHEPPSSWHAMTDPPFYEDGFYSPESFLGGLAILPSRDTTVATAMWEDGEIGLYWIDNATGGRDRTIDGREVVAQDEPGIGDVEAFCDPRAASIYLPIALAEDCLSETLLDVILVVDMSSSMLQVTSDGMEKHAAAIESSSRFVAALLEEDRGHRVSVLGFNDSVWHEGRWSGDEEEVRAALGRLPTKIAEGTRLDLALSEAASTARSPERRPGVDCAVILLTDGIPNRVPVASDGTQATTVLNQASALRATGATVFTIGLGRPDELDLTLLSQIATRTENSLHAPTAEALVALYLHLVHEARCGGR